MKSLPCFIRIVLILIVTARFASADITTLALDQRSVNEDWLEHREPMLQREMIRQAFLIQARETAGMATRDAALGESLISDSDAVLSVDFECSSDDEFLSYQFKSEDGSVLVEGKLSIASLTESYLPNAILLEKLSRTSDWGIPDAGNAALVSYVKDLNDVDALTDFLDSTLNTLNLVAQYEALSAAHQLQRTTPDTEAALGYLAQIYSHLGLLTEHYWDATPAVFKARSLLYAQRLVALHGETPKTLWVRAYVLANVGLHQHALGDLEQIATLDDDSARPEWSQALQAFLEFELNALKKIAESSQPHSPLAAKWYALLHDGHEEKTTVTAAARVSLAINPHDLPSASMAACRVSVGPQGEFLGMIYESLNEQVALVQEEAPAPATPPSNLHMIVPVDVINRLQAGELTLEDFIELSKEFYTFEMDTSSSRTEPSATLVRQMPPLWEHLESLDQEALYEPSVTCLEELLREATFSAVYFDMDLHAGGYAAGYVEGANALHPLYESHPYHSIITLMVLNEAGSVKKASELAAEFRFEEMPQLVPLLIHESLYGGSLELAQGRFDKLYPYRRQSRDETWRDLVNALRTHYSENKVGDTHKLKLAQLLANVSPNNNRSDALILRHDSKQLPRDSAPTAEIDPNVAGAMSKKFMSMGHYEAALPYLKATTESLDFRSYELLARAYLHLSNEEKFVETLEAAAELDDIGLLHYSAYKQIAGYYIRSGEPEKALPYAEKAAACGSEWGAAIAAACYLLVDRPLDAIEYGMFNASRYDELIYPLSRVIMADMDVPDEVREYIEGHLDDWDAQYEAGGRPHPPLILWHLGEQEAALELALEYLPEAQRPIEFVNAFYMAMELGKREQAMDILKRAQTYEFHKPWALDHFQYDLLKTTYDWFENGVDPIAERDSVLRKLNDIWEYPIYFGIDSPVAWTYGYILELAGHEDEAVQFYLRAIDTSSRLGEFSLPAYQELRERGIDPFAPETVPAPIINVDPRTFSDQINVTIHAWYPLAATRYTTDGTDPTPESLIYTYQLECKETTTYKAAQFMGEKRISPIVSATFTKEVFKPEPVTLDAADLKPGLQRQHQEIGEVESLDEIFWAGLSGGEAVTQITAEPFKGDDNFALRFYGYIKIAEAGSYLFMTNSDDGSSLSVAGQTVVNNDGLHGTQMRMGTVDLEPGYYPIEVMFFEAGGGEHLEVGFRRSAQDALEPLPAESLWHD